jgi:hypothetical protein
MTFIVRSVLLLAGTVGMVRIGFNRTIPIYIPIYINKPLKPQPHPVHYSRIPRIAAPKHTDSSTKGRR